MRYGPVAGALFTALALAPSAHAAAPGEQAAKDLKCNTCHAAAEQKVGPAYRDIAQRYGGDRERILALLKELTKTGSAPLNGKAGNWETNGIVMPPLPYAHKQTAQLERIAGWIAGLD